MLFHAGCMLRIAEIGFLGTSPHQINDDVQAGTLKRISSVSGGSIASAILGMNWSKIDVNGPNAGATFIQGVIGSVVLPDQEVITELESRGTVFRTDTNDVACQTEPQKIGPDNDDKPGGCHNVQVQVSPDGTISGQIAIIAD